MKWRTRGLLVLLAAVIVNAVVGYEYLVTHTFGARAKPSALEALIARKLRNLVTAPAVKRLKNPLDAAPLPVAEGRDHFADHCAFCHANDGSGKTLANDGLYPPAAFALPGCRVGAERMRRTGNSSSSFATCPNFRRKSSG